MPAPTLTATEIAGMIDHAILRPELTRPDVDAQLDVAARYRIFSVCVRPSDVAHAAARLAGTGVAVGTVIGFPHGTTSTAAKVAESTQAVADGAAELDMVVNVGRLRSGLLDDVEADVRAVVGAAGGRVVKVILETALLSDDEIEAGCRAAERAGAAFVKTSTGFAGGGATAEHVALMRRTVGPQVQVKASGGVRDLDTVLAFHAAGVTRFGTSGTATILDDAAARESGATGGARVDDTSY
ncbi:Deoxyribose-phosphate aldolase [Pseudonocardia sp. Ae168_Ps1]|uniref:deoxyribose-phosphate aldolase n=1 Tax=unclassified Pseudonocardia TaxID=2619320 RepID=UPI0001FFE5DF|nr:MULTISPECIES: deoxyribose-phosphate aldolase [unclassified Pseudonocardia]OLL75081.1 Deoxyribose-phosphate aldolase [Pseudonocardia sp. Ae150A_Ps1]OLL81076.1 Deoxyribose-phosphate aldolase [Pseudonocardia sp. Ae168_Ps1]OLL84809.1 Deoxyribose-phosphate aldolase [Pseudonocardia sp. Ae263_Ps1]OLL95174.1 Deoxyribose-phosphate aldolase [Pseudonocardia sp. Ae356_Ps1]OLM21539.1 Deoxyribose-phosphate aldolase [Pseudonocardia sp. Ae707_Ps1]